MRLDCFLVTLFLSQSTGALERSVVFLWQWLTSHVAFISKYDFKQPGRHSSRNQRKSKPVNWKKKTKKFLHGGFIIFFYSCLAHYGKYSHPKGVFDAFVFGINGRWCSFLFPALFWDFHCISLTNDFLQWWFVFDWHGGSRKKTHYRRLSGAQLKQVMAWSEFWRCLREHAWFEEW